MLEQERRKPWGAFASFNMYFMFLSPSGGVLSPE